MFITENCCSKFTIMSVWAPALNSPAENGILKKPLDTSLHSLSSQFLKRIGSGFEAEEAYIFMIRIDISSYTRALLRSNDLMIFKTSPEQISKVNNLSSVSKLIFRGVELLLSIIVHCLLK